MTETWPQQDVCGPLRLWSDDSMRERESMTASRTCLIRLGLASEGSDHITPQPREEIDFAAAGSRSSSAIDRGTHVHQAQSQLHMNPFPSIKPGQ